MFSCFWRNFAGKRTIALEGRRALDFFCFDRGGWSVVGEVWGGLVWKPTMEPLLRVMAAVGRRERGAGGLYGDH